jgi:hypothetical protein
VNPFSIGFRAARANLGPGLVIQALMIAIVLAFYFLPASRPCFQALAAAKAQYGYGFSAASGLVAGALLPMLLKFALLRRGRPTRAELRADLSEFLFLAVFWAPEGMIADLFYRIQGHMFGVDPSFSVVCKKVLFDQFVYNPFFAAPYMLAWYEWKNQGWRIRLALHAFTWDFYRIRTIPTLCATWVVWIPVTSAIYAVPSLLQIPLFALALTFWVLMLAYMTSRHHASEPIPAPLPDPVAD